MSKPEKAENIKFGYIEHRDITGERKMREVGNWIDTILDLAVVADDLGHLKEENDDHDQKILENSLTRLDLELAIYNDRRKMP